jgi:flagellar basal body-associated protein FliL
MATERVTERTDGVTAERTVERQDTGGTTVVERRGGGMGGILALVAVVALVAIVAYFLMNMNRQEAAETAAVTNAAENVGEAAQDAANSVANAAEKATQ